MRIGIVGAARIGGSCARQAVNAGHEVMLSSARDQSKLERLAAELGERASSRDVRRAMAEPLRGRRRPALSEPSPVDAEVVRALRAEILRPGQSPDELVYNGDDAPDSLHAAVLERGETIAVASVMREPFPPRPGASDWRLRGMATRPRERGRGAGRKLLELCIAHARCEGGTLLWCSARVPARGFYELAGLAAIGGVFEVPRIGPHVLMWLALAEPR